MWYKADWTGSPGCAAPMLRVELTNTNFTAPYKTVSLIYEPCENRSPLNKNVWYSEVIKPTTGVFWSELQAGTAKTLAQWKTYLDTNPTNYNNWVAGAVISDSEWPFLSVFGGLFLLWRLGMASQRQLSCRGLCLTCKEVWSLGGQSW